MSQSTGLAQLLFCLAASAGFCLAFVQYFNSPDGTWAQTSKCSIKKKKKKPFRCWERNFPSLQLGLGATHLFYFTYFSQFEEALSSVLRAHCIPQHSLKALGAHGVGWGCGMGLEHPERSGLAADFRANPALNGAEGGFARAQDQLGTSTAAFLRPWELARRKRQAEVFRCPALLAPRRPPAATLLPTPAASKAPTRERAVQCPPSPRRLSKSPENKSGFGQSTLGLRSTDCLSSGKKLPHFFCPYPLIRS